MSLSTLFKQHWDSAWAALHATPKIVFAIPFALAAMILVLRLTPLGWLLEKPVQEFIAPTVLAMATLFATIVHRWERQKITLMLAIYVWALFLRELHFGFMNGGILFALAGLLWWL